MPKTQVTDNLFDYYLSKGVKESATLKKLRKKTLELPRAVMISDPDQGAFMHLLAKIGNVKTYLEVGVFTGYSTLWVASALPKDGKVTALDISDEFSYLAKEAWEEAGVLDKIDYIIAPANETMQKLTNTYDMVFIDANKSGYIEYYELALKLLSDDGFILVDNIFMHGDVVSDKPSNTAKHIQRFNDYVSNDNQVDICIVPIGDGVTIIRKK